MDPESYLSHLRRELDAFRATLGADLGAPVEHCGRWTLRELAGHLGSGNLWAAAAVTEGHGDHHPPAPQDPGALLEWYDGGCATLLAALDADPAAPAWSFAPPRTVGFWQRRRAQETLIHRWDAEHALGAAKPLDPALAADGVAEVFDTMAPRMITRGLATGPPHALRVTATDTGASWTYGPGEPVATLAGPAGELLLLLWGRRAEGESSLSWSGDRAAGLLVLGARLTP